MQEKEREIESGFQLCHCSNSIPLTETSKNMIQISLDNIDDYLNDQHSIGPVNQGLGSSQVKCSRGFAPGACNKEFDPIHKAYERELFRYYDLFFKCNYDVKVCEFGLVDLFNLEMTCGLVSG